MRVGQPQDFGPASAVWEQGVVQVDALEALEEPAQGRMRSGLAYLVMHGLPRRGQMPLSYLEQALALGRRGELLPRADDLHDFAPPLWAADEDRADALVRAEKNLR
jgi:hypothetical protein